MTRAIDAVSPHPRPGAPQRRIVIVSPCRDEARFMRRTLDSVIAQTARPTLWVIVDDGSTDQTPAILAEYATQHPWIRVIRRDDRGRRAVGPGVIEAFYTGLESVDLDEFEFLCKLDLDLDLPPGYFASLIERMDGDPHLGTCSGKPYFAEPGSGRLVSEFCGDETSVGMTKFYRVACFREIGGFVRQVMWDGIDCHRCRMFGWKAASWDDPAIRFVHLRPMGSSQAGIWTGRKRHGFGQYFMGTSLAYMLASAVFRATKRPYIIGGLGMLAGYLGAMLARRPRYDDAAFRRFLRRYQWGCLFHGKAEATRRLDESSRERAAAGTAAHPL